MKKLLVLSVLSTLVLSACGKSAAQEAVEAINLNPGPINNPTPPAPPRAVLWTGTGSIKMTGTPEMACASVKVEIADDSAGFELRQFSYDCSGMTAQMDAIRLSYRGSELYMGTDKVGAKLGGVVDFTLKDPSGAALGFRFRADGNTLETVHTMKANGFEQTLTATLKQ